MPKRTQVFQQLPWIGGLNTSRDRAMISPNQLTIADNIQMDVQGIKRKREGIDFDYDSASNGDYNLIGLHDFWYIDSLSKLQRLLAVNANGNIYAYTSGTRTTLTVDGSTITAPTRASFETFQNNAYIAMDGDNNRLKSWSGDGNNVEDVLNDFDLTGATRNSSGTTRTLQFSRPFPGVLGSEIVITNAEDNTGGGGAADTDWNGTFTITSITTTTIVNDTVTFTGNTSVGEVAYADASIDVDGFAPKASIIRKHLGKLWANDKEDPDRLHYSATFNGSKWLGIDDSGAIDIGVGDGDPEGIVAIFPTFRGELFVAKKTKLYRVSGFDPASFSVTLVSSGIGSVSHEAIATVDDQDIVFVSERGVHSLASTDQFGDFESKFLSGDIQKSFNDDWDRDRLDYIKCRYISNLNSIAFAVSDESLTILQDNNNNISNNSLWLYHLPSQSWYRWPDISCEALTLANDEDKLRFYIGTKDGRVGKTFTDQLSDTNTAGDSSPINMKMSTGNILINPLPQQIKAFKKFSMIYRKKGVHTVTVTIKIDKF
ncbi:MAG: hypothetical protein KDF65_16865, partial [Anaerolineae bacterium]|nr:hypothetical protein [Anaerolineae bacterium]